MIPLLEPAVTSRVLLENPVEWHWRFSHALMQETLVAGLGRLPAARLHAQLAQALEARSDHRLIEVERLAHHFLHAVPITGTEPARRYATAAAVAARQRLAHTEAAAHTRRALTLLGSAQPAERHDLLVALGDDLLRSGHLQEAQLVIADALAVARELGDHARLVEAASVWGGVTLWNWRAYGFVDEDLVACWSSRSPSPVTTTRCCGQSCSAPSASSSPTAAGGPTAWPTPSRALRLARELGDPVLLGRTLNNYGLVAWGSPDRVERRLSATDETIALSGHGLPSRTEFFARLHRGPMRIHLGDIDGFQADLSAAHRLGAGLTGPEVRTHLLYQESGRAMLFGDWDEAEELALVANELYDATSLWGATATRAIHHFTFRRREGRLGTMLEPLVSSGDLGLPFLQSLAILATAESGDLEGARALRERWPAVTPEDWTSDVLMVVDAWLAIALGGDLSAAYAELLPFAGRQIVVGTAVACWGPYDSVLADLALARGDRRAALAHLEGAARQWGPHPLRLPAGDGPRGDPAPEPRLVTATTSPPAAVGFRSERGPVLAALMLCTGLVALDATIIATAVPSVVKDLGGFTQFPWLFSIYLLTQAVSVPLYGKFADIVGRRPVMFFGIATFLIGSVLCGVAWSMPALIAFRAVQGLGAGAVQPIALTIVGDLYSVEERARVQGYLASVWGISAVVGPTLGGVFSQYLSWRWIFFVNLPLGAVAWVTLSRRFQEKVAHREHAIDWAGAALLTTGCSLAILGLLEGGVAWAWGSTTSVAGPRGCRACPGVVRLRRAAGRRAGPSVVGLRPAHPRRRQPGVARRRRPGDRADLVRADVRAGGARERAPSWPASRWRHSRSAGRCRRPSLGGSTCGSGSATPR